MYRALAIMAALTLPVTAALSADWNSFTDAIVGFSVDIPADYSHASQGTDGVMFTAPDGTNTISVIAGRSTDPFERVVERNADLETGNEWLIGESVITPSWVQHTARKAGHIRTTRMIAICDRRSYARVDLTYSDVGSARTQPVLDRIAASLRRLPDVVCP